MDKYRSASHRPLPYVEWWYFHFATVDGTAINMVLHETDIFGLHNRPYLSLSVLLPGQPPRYFRIELEAIFDSGGQTLLDSDKGLIHNQDDQICFDVWLSKGCHFSGEISKLAGPVEINNGHLFENPISGQSSHWIIQVPHATFTATLRLDDQLIRLEGTAYHDHQWGNILIQEYVSDWVWGHFSNEQIAFTFFHILTQNGRIIERLSFISPEGSFSGTISNTNYLDRLINNQSLNSYTDSTSIGFLFNHFQVSFDINPSQLLRRRLNEEHDLVTASYLRWATEASLAGPCGPHSLYGISEYIRIRPTTYGSQYKSKHHQHCFRRSNSNYCTHRSAL